MMKESKFGDLKKNILDIKKNIREMNMFFNEMEGTREDTEKSMIKAQLESLKKSLRKTNEELKNSIEKLSFVKSLEAKTVPSLPAMNGITPIINAPVKMEVRSAQLDSEREPKEVVVKKWGLSYMDRQILKRLKHKEKKVEVRKQREANAFVAFSNNLFSRTSKSLLERGLFKSLKRDLIKANMQFLARSYLSVVLFVTVLSIFASVVAFVFFLFFNFGPRFPFITPATGDILGRIVTLFWIMIVIPIATFIVALLYPSMEKRTIENKINQELPFATIHMASISESLVEPSSIFKIIVSTREYPAIEKEFIKLLNEINLFGYDIVTALRNAAFNSPSKKLAELLDGLATTITSGGNLAEFFDKRSQTLLFEHKLEKEKQTKSAETFMDIYISVVIAAPMILMLLLIMMRVSGLGISLSTTMISIIMVLGVSVINVGFLTFLQLKQQA
jgi:Flp pilus assembly protein TadB